MKVQTNDGAASAGRRKSLKLLLAGFAGLFLPPVTLADTLSESKVAEVPANSILLYEGCVAGVQHHECAEHRRFDILLHDALEPFLEENNPHDDNAIALYWKGYHLGYVPMRHNRVVSNLLRQNMPVTARVSLLDAKAPIWEQIQFQLFLKQG